MNDKDKEAFEKWMESEDRHDGVFGNNNNFTRDEWVADKAWQAACEYKQKEIDELIKQLKHEHDLYKKHLKVYEDENAKLRECVEFYAYSGSDGSYARRALKELEEK